MDRKLLVVVAILIGGCSSSSSSDGQSPQAAVSVVGKWQSADEPSRFQEDVRLEFTQGENVILTLIVSTPWLSETRKQMGRFRVDGKSLHLMQEGGTVEYRSWWAVYEVEFIANDEMLLVLTDDGISVAQPFLNLGGRWRRVSSASEQASPLADTTSQVKRFQNNRERLQPLLGKALADRDELVVKLRQAGVRKAADLKGNYRGQQLARSLQRLIAEIDGLERNITAVDRAILEAKAIVRRLEREKEGISEHEMRKLAEQLRELEERGDEKRPLTPFDLEAALEKALGR